VNQPAQLSLLSRDELSSIVEEHAEKAVFKEGEYTLDQFRQREPRLLQAVVSLRAAGMGIKDVARLLNVHNRTVMAVDREYADSIVTRKERVARLSMMVSELAMETALERLADGRVSGEKLRDIVISAAAASDKALLLAGEATRTIDVRFSAPGQDEFARQLAEMGLGVGSSAAKGAIEAECSEVPGDGADYQSNAGEVQDVDA